MSRNRYTSKSEDGLIAGLGCLALILIFVAIILFGGLIFWLAWNVGVVGIVSAAGGSVGEIGYWTAVGGSLAVGVLSRIFRRTTVESK